MPANGDPLERALSAAAHAVILDPECATGHLFLACAHFHCGDDAAFYSSAEEALRLNPGHADLLADIGSCLCFLGDGERGGELVDRALALNPAYPGWYRLPAVIQAFAEEQFEQALSELRKAPMPAFFWWLALKAATHAKLGEEGPASEELDSLLSMQPDFTERFDAEARKWRVPDSIVNAVAEGLRIAGLALK